jgi:PadR family transcriptional regulator PadR
MVAGPERITASFLDVLDVFVEAGDEEIHGWAIIKASHRGGPTVYKILERLADMGWIVARWEMQPPETSRPRRRYYRLTGDGAARARALLADRRSQRPRSTTLPAFGRGSL